MKNNLSCKIHSFGIILFLLFSSFTSAQLVANDDKLNFYQGFNNDVSYLYNDTKDGAAINWWEYTVTIVSSPNTELQ